MYLESGQKCDLATLTSIYGDSDVAQSILDSAQQNKTVSRIESGDLTLPELHDAHEFHHRKHWTEIGLDVKTQDTFVNNPQLHGMFQDFESRLAKIEGKKG